VCAIYEIHGVGKLGLKGRRALAEKLGVVLPATRGERIRERIWALRESGMTWPGIAEELGMKMKAVVYYAEQLRREKREGAPAEKRTEAVGSSGGKVIAS